MLQIDFKQDSILDAKCSCVRGTVSCHHMAAVMLHAYRSLSVTDKECSWSVKNKGRALLDKSNIPIESLNEQERKRKNTTDHRNGKKVKGKLKKTVKTKENDKENAEYGQEKGKENEVGGEIEEKGTDRNVYIPYSKPFILTEDLQQDILAKIKNCKGGAASFGWLISKEPEEDEAIEGEEENFITIVQPADLLKEEESFFLEKLRISQERIIDVALHTTGQRSNPLWFVVKEYRLTASNFGKILHCFKKKNGEKPAASLLKNLAFPKNIANVRSIKWGIDHEAVAIKQFEEATGLVVLETGIWLHESGLIGGSPDGLVGDEAIVEVKCPYKYRFDVLEDVLSQDSSYFIQCNRNKEWSYNPNHEYYSQIQACLTFTKRKTGYFVCWTTKSMTITVIEKDEQWGVKNIPLLKKFYVKYYLPYLKREIVTD